MSSTSTAGAPRVVIVGGGYSGAVFALHLVRLARRPVHVVIVEPRQGLGRGVAYSSTDPIHRINVPAAKMAVFEDQLDHFDRWAWQRGAPLADPIGLLPNGDFYAARGLFGAYVGELLQQAEASHPAATVEHRSARAIGFEAGCVVLDDGTRIGADIVLLATGNEAPALPAPLRAVAGDPRLVGDVWAADSLARIAPGDRVLIVGSALTMADVVASLRAKGHSGPIEVMSRHGLLCLRKRPGPYEITADFSSHPARKASQLLRNVRREVELSQAAGEGWEPVLDAVRQQGRAIWGALRPADRGRAIRALRAYWDIHRYQVSPPVADVLDGARASGQVRVRAASLISAAAVDSGIEIVSRRRGAKAPEREVFDVVVNCTGPGIQSLVRSNPLLAALHASGEIEPDPLGLGLAVGKDSRVLGPRPGAVPIYALGSLARGQFGELTAAREISAQAGEIAVEIARHLSLADDLPQRADRLDLYGPADAVSPPQSLEHRC